MNNLSGLIPIIIIILFGCISNLISSIKEESVRKGCIFGALISVVVFMLMVFNYGDSRVYDLRKSGCEEIRYTVFGFEGKYTNADMNEEGEEIYKKCMNIE